MSSPRPRNPDEVKRLFTEVTTSFARHPFVPHRIFSGAHGQTLGAYAWPRRNRLKPTAANDEERLFQVEDDVQVLAQCRWQANKIESPTIVIWHGMEGSTSSVYMWSTADKAFRAGFNVVRVNYRNCGGTEHLTPTLYHGGMSADLNKVIEELISRDSLKRLYPVGFSLGGNMVLKLLGEYGNHPPAEVIAAAVVSPSVDLKASTDLILKGSNWIYHRNFVTSLKNRLRLKNQLFPERYDITKLAEVKNIREFDEVFTSKANGFVNADEYYYKSSSVRVVDQIRVPTLIIHAEDDPFIPFGPLLEKTFVDNPYLLLIKTERGGHVAFISVGSKTEDRFWAENRVVEFCRLSENGRVNSE
ncbi:MAG TPA: alpha/beta fold hydrolase [Pyrinomonadaceae bacterium]